jgi:hypothetical protein
VCGTLAEWLQQQLASSSAQGGRALALADELGQRAALSRVLVVEEWTDELRALLAAPHNRQAFSECTARTFCDVKRRPCSDATSIQVFAPRSITNGKVNATPSYRCEA